MAKLITNNFTSYELTEREVLEGTILNTAQKRVLQNQLAERSHSKLSLVLDPSAVVNFAQREAEARGAIDLINWMLANSELAEQALLHADS